jgi:hypothetical protein
MIAYRLEAAEWLLSSAGGPGTHEHTGDETAAISRSSTALRRASSHLLEPRRWPRCAE